MNSLILAALLTLYPGYNNPGVAGEVVAMEAATSNETATIELKSVQAFTLYTNATAEVISYETAYAITYTNFDGEASISTNVVGYLDLSYFYTNGVSKILNGPTRFDLPITNEVVVATLPSEVFAVTNEFASLTTADHFAAISTNAYLLGDAIIVTGAEDGDVIKVLVK